MSKGLSEEKLKAMTLYQLLCIKKEASTNYLVETGKIIKLQDIEKRKQIHKTNMKNLLDATK